MTGNVLSRGVVTIWTVFSLKSLLLAEIPRGISHLLKSKDGYLWHKLMTLKLSSIKFDILIVLIKFSWITFEGAKG